MTGSDIPLLDRNTLTAKTLGELAESSSIVVVRVELGKPDVFLLCAYSETQHRHDRKGVAAIPRAR